MSSWADLRSRAPDEIQCVGGNGVVRVRVSALVLEAGVMCGLGDAARRADKVVEAAAGGGARVGLCPGYELPYRPSLIANSRLVPRLASRLLLA